MTGADKVSCRSRSDQAEAPATNSDPLPGADPAIQTQPDPYPRCRRATGGRLYAAESPKIGIRPARPARRLVEHRVSFSILPVDPGVRKQGTASRPNFGGVLHVHCQIVVILDLYFKQ